MRIQPWEVLAEAWTPYMGVDIATERARNAAMIPMGFADEMTPEFLLELLVDAVERSTTPTYGSVRLTPREAAPAVQDAIDALAAHGMV